MLVVAAVRISVLPFNVNYKKLTKKNTGTSQRAAEAKRLTDTVDTIVPRLLNVPTNTIESLARVLSSTWILYRTSPKMLLLLCVALPAKTCLEAFLEHTENAVERTVIVRSCSCWTSFFVCVHILHSQKTQVQESSTHNRRILRETWSRVLSSRKMRTVRHLAREPEMLRVYERVLRSEMRRQDRAGLVWRLFDPLRALGDHGLRYYVCSTAVS